MAEMKKIVRLMAADIDGGLSVERAIRKIKGISFMFSNAVCISLGIERNRKIGMLSQEELKRIEDAITQYQYPKWLLNRKNDTETGSDIHITGVQIHLKKREDINTLKKMRAYRGIRHELGQPVRGQRTRSTFRTQKAVGVSKKRVQQPAKKAGK